MTSVHGDVLAAPPANIDTIIAEDAARHTNEQRIVELQTWLSQETEPYRVPYQEAAGAYNRAISDLAQLAIAGTVENFSTQVKSQSVSGQSYRATRVSGTHDAVVQLAVSAIPVADYENVTALSKIQEKRVLSPEALTLPQKHGFARPALLKTVRYTERRLQPTEDSKQAQFTYKPKGGEPVHYTADGEATTEHKVERLPRFEEIAVAADNEYRDNTLQSVFSEQFIGSYQEAEELDKATEGTYSVEEQATRRQQYDAIAAELREAGILVPGAYMDEVAAKVAEAFTFPVFATDKLDANLAEILTHPHVRQIARIVGAYSVGDDQAFKRHRLDWFAQNAPAFNEAYLNELESNAAAQTQLVETKVAEAQVIADTTQAIAHTIMSQTVPLDSRSGWQVRK